jgi:hypothetical protein
VTTKTQYFQQRIGLPPKGENPQVQRYLQSMADAVNRLPAQSVFSFSTPESNVSANVGQLGINIASGVSVLWVKQSGTSDIGWVAIA